MKANIMKQFDDQLGYTTLNKMGHQNVINKVIEIINPYIAKAPEKNQAALKHIVDAFAEKATRDDLAEFASCFGARDEEMSILGLLNNWYMSNK